MLVDQNGIMQSVAPHDVTAPFVCEWSGHGVTRVRGLLASCPLDVGCVTAIVDALPHHLASPENNPPCSDGPIEASAGAIADSLIGIAGTVPANAGVIFDACVPTAPNRAGTLMFDERGCGGVVHRDRPAHRVQCRGVRRSSAEHTGRPATTCCRGQHVGRYRASAGEPVTGLAVADASTPPVAPDLGGAWSAPRPPVPGIGWQ
jgi:hypothetical protein